MEVTTAEQTKEKRMKRIEHRLREIWDNIKCTNIRIIGVPEKERSDKIFEEITLENFSNIGKEIVH